MTKRKQTDKQSSWFYDMILNNRGINIILIIIIIVAAIYGFTKIAYLFTPIGNVISMFAFPVITAGIMYYLFAPLVDFFSRRGVDRRITIWVLFILLIVLIIWGISTLVPILRSQMTAFINNIPNYVQQIEHIINELPLEIQNLTIPTTLDRFFDSFDLTNLTNRFNSIITSTFDGIGSVIGTITQFISGLLIFPIMLYYLLLEGNKIYKFTIYLIPNKYHESAKRLLYRMNFQIAQYIRGQIIVALIVGIIFAIGYSIIGLDYGISLAVLAGILNIIPYLGSIIAVIPAIIIAALTSPTMLLKVALVIAIEQTIEGRFISPQVLGNSMEIHPVTILVIILAAGKLFGLTGVILGVPGYAVIKVIVTEIYRYYRKQSPLYQDEPVFQLGLSDQVDVILPDQDQEQADD